MKQKNAYSDLPDHCFWKRGVTNIKTEDMDPMVGVPFTLLATDKIATAGSCFAQHIARHLKQSGLHFLNTEPAHSLVDSEDAVLFNYGTFTARYGNVYTVRQLLQLFRRAYGLFIPAEPVWMGDEGSWLDPFRPQIQPGGFASLPELQADREKHLKAVRNAFETLNVLIFTLGLTEAWEAKQDGAIFPLCPGVAGGVFDSNSYQLHEFDVSEVIADLLSFIKELRSVNSTAKLILTVSPVPLMATAFADKHVLSATSYSKSVLRVACEMVSRQTNGVAYFPAYEIITSHYIRGGYFAADGRSVTEAGITHVMRVFLKHFTEGIGDNDVRSDNLDQKQLADRHVEEMAEWVRVDCDEEALDK